MADVPDLDRKPVLVLGASGFIGTRVVEALVSSRQWRPIPVMRRAVLPGSLGADATDPAAVRGALNASGYVINCIAGSERTMLRATNVLCDAARIVPQRRIVHLSSMAVYGAATGSVREDQPPVSPVSGYGQAKINCEQVLQRYQASGGDTVTLRPSCVFGPGSPQWTTRISRLLTAGRIGDLGAAGDGGCNLVFIDDLVTTIVAALDAPGVSGAAFNVSNMAIPTWNEFLMSFGKAVGATPIRRIAPNMLKIESKLLAPLRRIAAKGIHHPATEAITPSLVALWAQDIRIDSSAAATRLGMPSTPMDRMIDASVRWLKRDAETTHGAEALDLKEPARS